MQALEQNILDEMVRRLVAEFQPEKIILFGSYAWGEPSEDSDVDLFVIVPESDERQIQRMQRAHHCLGDLRLSTDILVKTRAEADRYRNVRASLEHKIFEEGRVLYG
ncbi:MAG: nucleotidyltransferase domain-containing protein [Planctomycetes bacterium]|nr:nucleotidyltransferase domain-containing protein [Planctomycetota bacterium]MBU4400550.1 nucleotidyltransferase domain-containing protein [Planctomycetota bacterium]MCG2682710.1 nucleotidyltransferase domain-containing protein [Planctomycetales bacterium]